MTVHTMRDTLLITKALADQGRLRILMALSHCGELCVGHIAAWLGLSAGTISRHMRILQTAQLVTSRREGRWVHYCLDTSGPAHMGTAPVLAWLHRRLETCPQIEQDRHVLTTMLGECNSATGQSSCCTGSAATTGD